MVVVPTNQIILEPQPLINLTLNLSLGLVLLDVIQELLATVIRSVRFEPLVRIYV